jgi:hypothetical protein
VNFVESFEEKLECVTNAELCYDNCASLLKKKKING